MEDVAVRLRAVVRNDPGAAVFVVLALVGTLVALSVWGLPKWLAGGPMVPFGLAFLSRFKALNRPLFQPIEVLEDHSTVADTLTSLGPDYRVLPKVRTAMGFVDHVVVGPTGVFALRTAPPEQQMVVGADGRPHMISESGESAVRRAQSRADELSGMLEQAGVDVAVRSLVITSGRGSERWAGGSATVDFLMASALAPRLTMGPDILGPQEVDRATLAVLGVAEDTA